MTATLTTPRKRQSDPALRLPYRILVASNGEDSSLGAIRVAVALARRKSARVDAFSVIVPFPHKLPNAADVAPPAMIDEANRREALELLREQIATVNGTKNWAIRASVGWPAGAIVDAAERWPATLLILGLGEHSMPDRIIGSETSIHVVRHSHVPVLAVPKEVTGLPVNAVAAVDFTESSLHAAVMAASLLGPNGKLTLLHASALANGDPTPGSLLDVYAAGANEKLVEVAARVHRETKRRVRIAVVPGGVIGQLLLHAEREHCDLIALGGEERGFLDRLLTGSVRSTILRQAQCAVLVTPASA